MSETSRQWLRDALHSARLIQEHTQGVVPETYATDQWFRSAVERQLEIIGEALYRVRKNEADIEIRFPKIHEWIAQRNVLAHVYDEIDDRLIWLTVVDELPGLIETLESLIDQEAT